ncbi:MAG: IcmE protein, partial [uncultured bacterium]
GIIVLIYAVTRYFSGDAATTGPSRVAGAPQGLQSVPGGELTPEYYRALTQANIQAAQQAQITGGSAVPTLINVGGQPTGQSPSCTVICGDEAANVKNSLDEWVKQGKISPELATALQQLADKNVSVDDYAAELDRLVKEGKLTPEQARQLLEQYKKQHGNKLLQDSAKMMDDLIKSGKLPLDVANQLLAAQKANVSPAEYAAQLAELVRQGKLSPEAAQMLLAQYTQQRAKEIVAKSVASLRKLAREGQITPDVESELEKLENEMVPVDMYSSTLQRLVSQGKLIPAVAGKILDEFKSQKAAIGPTGTVNQMLQKAEAAAYAEINDLLKAGKMSQEVAVQLTDLIQKDIPLKDYQETISKLVQDKKLSPEIAKLKIADYQQVKGLREMAQRLGTLQANNASVNQYTDALKKAVAEGKLTPEQAAQLLQEYQAMTAVPVSGAAITAATGPGSEEFAKLQQRVQEGTAVIAEPAAVTGEFSEAQLKAQQELDQQRQVQIENISAAMTAQAQQLISSWQPVVMEHKEGTPPEDKSKTGAAAGAANGGASAASTGAAGETTSTPSGPPLIKAGTVLFAVLDTGVNSDYPTSPVMATIVDGKYKGAKLIGKLTTTKGVAGQLDRVMLNFNLMNQDDWIKSKTINAFAVDPDSARSVFASQVNYHYLQRYGAIMATSFIQGYASAITSAGTSTTGIFGTSTTHPELGPTQKLAVALGQIGQSLGTVTQNYVNIPPTVKVDSGVGLGILFMSDVT